MTYKDFFKQAKLKQITNIQITEKQNIGNEIEVLNGKLESFEKYNNTSYAIKAEYNNKTVKLNCNYLASDILDLLIMKGKSTDTSYEDEYLEKDKNIKKEKLKPIDVSQEVNTLKELEKIKTNYKEVKQLKTYYYEESDNTRIINSNGVDISTSSHICDFLVEVIVSGKDNPISYDRRIMTTNKKDINFHEFTKDVIEKAIISSTREKLECRKYNIILDNNTASSIIYHLVPMLSSSSIRTKVSCLESKLNKKVFSNKLTILEEPTAKKYPGYTLFDDEGTKTINKTIIDQGRVKTFLYNIKEAKLNNIKSTANGYLGIDTRNMHVVKGEKSKEELLKDLDNGIYITDYMGAQNSSINNVNGNISLQIFGFIVKNGKIIKGFEPAIMTTTIFELLSNIKDIGSDLVFMNQNCASPSILIKDISIAS